MDDIKSDMVMTPLGKAHIRGRSPEGDEIMVLFSRKDYTKEEWLKISPGNGPCVFRMYGKDELKESEEK